MVLSLFLTVITNILGILSVSFLLRLYLTTSSVTISPGNLAYKLTLTTLLPTLTGILIRRYIKHVPELTKRFKQQLSMTSVTALMTIVWMSMNSARELILQQNIAEVFSVFLVNLAIHCFFLLGNYAILTKARNVPFAQVISLTIMANSQKSSPVAISVINIIAKSGQEKGLLMIPCLLGQLAQIFVGSFVSNYFAKQMLLEEGKQQRSKAKKN